MAGVVEIKVIGLPSLMRKFAMVRKQKQLEAKMAFQQILLAVETRATEKAPVGESGALAASIESWMTKSGPHVFEGYVGTRMQGKTDIPYAYFVEYGTGMYGPKKQWIYPKTQEAMAFELPDGTEIVRKRVKGQKKQPFMRPAIKYGERVLLSRFKKVYKMK